MSELLRRHWRQYLMEAIGPALFISSGCLVTTLVEHPDSPVRQAVDNPLLRRAIIGIWMGLTIFALASMPWGKKSGAHHNPAVTWAFHRMGKIATRDAVCYTLAQFTGAVIGITITGALLAHRLAHPLVNFNVTQPGPKYAAVKFSPWVAFGGEFAIAFLAMFVLIRATASKRWEKRAALFIGVLLMVYIIVESPLSGMSLNPARSFASAFAARSWTALWVYLTAPTLAMLLAAELCRHRSDIENVPQYPKEKEE